MQKNLREKKTVSVLLNKIACFALLKLLNCVIGFYFLPLSQYYESMKTRSKLIVLQVFTLIVLLLSILGFQQIQRREQKLFVASKIKSDEQIINNVLEFNNEKYLGAAKTNSCWNEMVDFVNKPDSAWAKLGIGEIVLTFKLNYAGVFNYGKNTVYEIYKDFKDGENNIGISDEMIDDLFKNSPYCHFFLKCNSGYLEVFGSTIVTVDDSEHKGKPYGYLLIGKLWDTRFISEIENVSGFKIRIYEYNAGGQTKTEKSENNKEILTISKSFDDWNKNPIVNVDFLIFNQLEKEYRFSRYLSLFIAVFSIIVILFFFLAVRKWIHIPLISITDSLNKGNVDLLDGIMNRKNEFGEISRLIKQFFFQRKNLEKEISERLKAEEELKFAYDNLELKVVERTNALLSINTALESEILVRKKAEEIIKKQIVDLEEKNAEMERFTYTVSHDLKSPLITINGFAGLILEKIKEQDYKDLDVDINRIMNATNKMQELLKDLLELSKVGRMSNHAATFNMTELANEVVELLQGILCAKKIKVTVQENMPDLTTDKQRIKEVLQNLVENAAKFMDNNKNACITIGCRTTENENVFFIEDNGPGIEAKYQHKIFGLFDKLDQHSEGTGIGLALVKRIIELHNGRIWVESNPGKGSVFFFTVNSTKTGH
jgi:signal transduction histidine kinase/sensor domain CHASE-containing protein